MAKNKKKEKGLSMTDIAMFFVKDVEKLANSKNEGEKRLSLIAILLCISLSFVVASSIQNNQSLDLFAGLIYLVIGGIISAILCLVVLKVLVPLSKSLNHDKFGQDLTVSSLFLSLGFSIAGFLLQVKPLIVVSLVFSIGGIILLYPIVGHFKIPIKQKEEQQTKFGFWSIMGKIKLITGIIASLTTIATFVIKFL